MNETQTITSVTPRLIICGGEKPIQFPLDGRVISLGRGERNRIQIHRSCVSFWHLELHQLAAGRYKIVDLNSRNGTTVNGISIGSCELADGDRIVVGREVVIHYLVHPAEEEFEEQELREFQTIDDRLRSLTEEQFQLRKCLRKKTAEYENLLNSIVALKRNSEPALQTCHSRSPEDDDLILPS